MKLMDLMSQLALNELSNTSFAEENSSGIRSDNKTRLVSIINNVMLDLHQRFILLEKELIIQSLDWKNFYSLKKEYAVSSGGGGLKYIIDTPEQPFLGDILSIISVANEEGIDLPLNDPENSASVFITKFDELQLNHPGCNQVFFVNYQAAPKILITDPNAIGFAQQEIELPMILFGALRDKIIWYIYSSMAGQDFSGKTQEIAMRYEETCQRIENSGQVNQSSNPTNLKLPARGFP